ncbi:glutamate-cysteine ligase family protein [Nonomuraea wenchangensis]
MNSQLTERIAIKWIRDTAFSSRRVGRVGIELEWLLVRDDSPDTRVNVTDVKAYLGIDDGPLPSGGYVTFEPGGQLELSTAPADSLAECLDAATRDLEVLRSGAIRSGLTLLGRGLDHRTPARVVHIPRTVALERNYDHFGPYGRVVMYNTASVQVNVDAGDDSSSPRGWRYRWWLANSLGPVFTAMFANSPLDLGVPERSRRQVLRFLTDPTRTSPLPLVGDPREAWADYVLDARVVGIAQSCSHALETPPSGLTMRQWLRGAGPRRAHLDDLDHHLRSVLPPVRPRGYLELRMIDAQEGDNWVVPVVTVSALLDDLHASRAVRRIAETLPLPSMRETWMTAARDAMGDPRLAEAAQRCMAVVIDALERMEVPGWVRPIVHEFAEVYTFRGRCPADDHMTSRQPLPVAAAASGRSIAL